MGSSSRPSFGTHRSTRAYAARVVPLLIYDGDCGFCTRSARWIAARWRPGTARIVASQSLDDAALAEHGLTRADVIDAAWWVGTDGVPERGDRAIAAALRGAPGWPNALGRAISMPGVSALAPVGYALVARFRHRLPGASEACAVRPEIADR